MQSPEKSSEGNLTPTKVGVAMVAGALNSREAAFPNALRSEVFQSALALLPKTESELIGSQLRGSVTDAVVAEDRKAVPAGIKKLLGKFFGKPGAEHPVLTAEIDGLASNRDESSFATQALEADLLMAKGDKQAAVERYTSALRAAKEGGYQVME